MKSSFFLLPLSVVRESAVLKFEGNRDNFYAEAQRALEVGHFRVTDKDVPPPGGTLHDYWSMGPYWWPNPDNPDGLPYIRKDGHLNPDSMGNGYDRARIEGLVKTVGTLMSAWFVTGDKKYSKRIADLLRTFFIDADTRMNPSLTYGQAIPGICDGRGIGIIETVRLIELVNAIVYLQEEGEYPDDDLKELCGWFGSYVDWLMTSQHGADERAAKNNHGTWMDAQIVAFALFTGRLDLAREVALEVPTRRIDIQIMGDGSQPLELARTRAFSYSVYNLTAFATLAQLARAVNVDLWNYLGPEGQSIPLAYEYLKPFATGEKPWTYRQIDKDTGVENSKLDKGSLDQYKALYSLRSL
ncbi:MAG: alginate lyase family protein [Lentisphaerae bacterium]|jgi:hypothetical protein|nr:alginate lyase family protein [Lentisphaerota bacterium]